MTDNDKTLNEALEAMIKVAENIDKPEDEVAEDMKDIIKALKGGSKVEDNWDDLFAMLDDMKAHAATNGQAIISQDRPMELRCAYVCTNTGKTWSIRISNLKKSIDNYPDMFKQDIMRRAFISQEGKQALVDTINGK